jgi:3',5'-cyclic AMP phosphodiesterase CpdA
VIQLRRPVPCATLIAMRIALFGDIHLYRLALHPWHLLSKRVLGQINLWLSRRTRFDRALAESLVEQVDAIDPDLVICPGDLTTTALHSEFRLARRVLGDLLQRRRTFVIPGNHDRYTFTASRRRRFEQYFAAHTADRWPHHEPIARRLHLMAIDATRPNLLLDRGRVGDAQRSALAHALDRVDRDDHILMLCHYTLGAPPDQPAEGRAHRLIDQTRLLTVLRESGRAVLFVHGHVHRPWCWRPDDAPGVVALNAGSPTHVDRTFPTGQGFWQLDFDADRGSTPWRLIHRRPTPDGSWADRPIDWPTAPGQSIAIP